jgi:hypothetical protein
MDTSLTGRVGLTGAVLAAVLSACAVLILATPSAANASESQFCYGTTLSNHNWCVGEPREMNAVYGLGASNSVCVWGSFGPEAGTATSVTCSPGPNQGTYNGGFTLTTLHPVIQINAAGTSAVYGVAFRP